MEWKLGQDFQHHHSHLFERAAFERKPCEALLISLGDGICTEHLVAVPCLLDDLMLRQAIHLQRTVQWRGKDHQTIQKR